MRKNNTIYQLMRNWESAGLDGEYKTSREKDIMETIDQIQQEAFMEGYRYAIEVLKEGMVKKEEN